MKTALREAQLKLAASLLTVLVLAGIGLGVVRHDSRSPLLRTVGVGQFPALAVVSAPLGQLFVANTNESTVSVLDTRSGRVLRTIAVGGGRPGLPRITGAVADARGTHLFIATDDGFLAMVDARTGTVLRYLAIPSSSDPAMDNAQAHVFAADRQAGLVRMIDARTGRILRTSAVDGHPDVVVVDAQTQRVFVTGGQARGGEPQGDGRLSVLDAASGRVVRIVSLGSAPCLCLGPPLGHGPVFVSDTKSGRLYVLDPTTARVRRTVNLGLTIYDHALDPITGRIVLVGAPPSPKGTIMPFAVPGRLVALDARSGAVVRRLTLATPPATVAVDPRTRHVLLGLIGRTNVLGEPQSLGQVTVLDERSLRVLRTLPAGIMPWHITVDAAAQRAFVLNANVDPSCLSQASYLPTHITLPEDRWTALARHVKQWLPWLPLQVAPPPVTSPNGSITVLNLTQI